MPSSKPNIGSYTSSVTVSNMQECRDGCQSSASCEVSVVEQHRPALDLITCQYWSSFPKEANEITVDGNSMILPEHCCKYSATCLNKSADTEGKCQYELKVNYSRSLNGSKTPEPKWFMYIVCVYCLSMLKKFRIKFKIFSKIYGGWRHIN